MADGIDAPAPSSPHAGSGHGIKGFLTAETAGMPNWVWGVVVLVGVGLVFIVPRLRGSSGNTSQTSSSNGTPSGVGMAIDPTTGLPYAVEGLVPSGAVAGGSSGQTSDLAALEALLSQTLANQQGTTPPPSDGGSSNGSTPPTDNKPTPPGLWWLYTPPGQTPGGPVSYPGGSPGGPPKSPDVPAAQPAPAPAGHFVNVDPWGSASGNTSLWGIAQNAYGNGALWPTLQQANAGRYPSLSSNPNLVQPGWSIWVPNR